MEWAAQGHSRRGWTSLSPDGQDMQSAPKCHDQLPWQEAEDSEEQLPGAGVTTPSGTEHRGRGRGCFSGRFKLIWKRGGLSSSLPCSWRHVQPRSDQFHPQHGSVAPSGVLL